MILLDETRERVLLGKRKNSYKAGYYGLPGGRIELGEEAMATARREVKEETDIEVISLEFVSAIRENQEKFQFIHHVFVSSDWGGVLKTLEPDKCEGWQWHLLENLPNNILHGHKLAIESYLAKTPIIDSFIAQLN